MQPDSTPYLLRVTYPVGYPFIPIGVKFLTRVPHPFIGQDGSVSLDADWSACYKIQSILVLIQSVLTEPLHNVVQNSGCVTNPSWQSEHVDTSPQFRPQLFRHLLKAASAEGAYMDWRCLRAIHNFMVNYHGAHVSSRQEWYEFLRSLASQVLNSNARHRRSQISHSSNLCFGEQADVLWLQEAKTLLDRFFRMDALRILVTSRTLRLDMGRLHSLPGLWDVWAIIRSFVSDIADAELFAGGPLLLRCVEQLSARYAFVRPSELAKQILRCSCLSSMAPLLLLSPTCSGTARP